jgi:uncharacterized protein YukE
MKNTKLIGLVALLVVVVLVVSVVIATSADKANMKPVTDKLTAYEQQLAQLNKTLAEVQSGLKSANQALEELKAAGVIIKDFDEATAKVFDKYEELETKVDEYENAKDEKGNALFNAALYHNYAAKKSVILQQAQMDLFRATSVKAMDEIIAKVLEDLKALPTKVQEYATLVDAIEKNGVKVEDKENVMTVLAGNMTGLTWDLYEGADQTAKEAAKTALDKRFNDALVEYKKVVTAEFVATVTKLPAVDALKLTDEKALDDARAQYVHLTTDLGLTFVAADDAYKAEASLVALEARETLLAGVKADADAFNTAFKTWFEAFINAKEFGLNNDTVKALDGLKAAVDAKLASYETTLNVILDSTKAGFNEYVYNFIDHTTVKGYSTKYDEVKANLSTLADAYLAAVKALGEKKTYADLDAANTAAWEAWYAVQNSFGASVGADQVDTYLKNTKNEVATANTTHNGISGKLYDVKAKIDAISDYLASTKKIVCQQPTVHTGTVACDCKTTETTLTLDGIQAIVETNLYPLLTHELNFTEEVIGAELLASLKAAYVEAATAAIKATHAKVSGDDAYANVALKNALANVTVEKLTFAAVYDETTKTWDWAEGYKTLLENLVKWTSVSYFYSVTPV